ncbi:MAG: FtsB family cell division protein [Anaerotignum sp.]
MDSIFVRVFLAVFICSVGVGVVSRVKAYEEIKQERLEISAQIEEEKQKQQEYEKDKEYYNSDSYIEKIAREQLGMIKSNEVLYVNKG